MQPMHRLLELARDHQRQHIERIADRTEDRLLVGDRRSTKHPRRDAILVARPRMSDPEAQAMELAVPNVRENVAQSVLSAVAAIEL